MHFSSSFSKYFFLSMYQVLIWLIIVMTPERNGWLQVPKHLPLVRSMRHRSLQSDQTMFILEYYLICHSFISITHDLACTLFVHYPQSRSVLTMRYVTSINNLNEIGIGTSDRDTPIPLRASSLHLSPPINI